MLADLQLGGPILKQNLAHGYISYLFEHVIALFSAAVAFACSTSQG